jgi:hypothetical protein
MRIRLGLAKLLVATLVCWLLEPPPLFSGSAVVPKLGSRLPRTARPTGKLIMIHSADLAEEFNLSVEGRIFSLGVSSKRRVSHIETRDPQFTTPEGVRVGNLVRSALNVPGARFGQWPGCFAFVVLPSGWAAGFWPVQTDLSRPASDKVVYLDLKNAADVPDTMIVGFVFKSMYLR